MIDFVHAIILNEKFFSALTIVLTAIVSYYFAKRTDASKHRSEVASVQLNKIFLPLYLLVFATDIDNINFDNLLTNMIAKKKRYFLYLSSEYILLVDTLNMERKDGTISNRTKKMCKRYIEFEYIRLRRILGYPCNIESLFNSYYLFHTIKNIVYLVQAFLFFSISVVMIFGGELYEYYKPFYNFASYTIGVVSLIDILLLFCCIFLYLYWHVDFKELVFRTKRLSQRKGRT